MLENKKTTYLIVLAVFIIALLARLLVAFYSPEVVVYDIDRYNELALNILEGRGFTLDGRPSTFHEPFYSYFLAAVYYLFGYSYTLARVIQCVIGSVICILIFFISKRLFNLKIAVISASIACLNPGFIKSVKYLMTENIFTLLFLISIFFIIKYTEKRDLKDLIFSGVALGVATLTRSAVFLFPFFIVLLLLKRKPPLVCSIRRNILSAIIFMLCFILPIIPWTLRNWRVYHRFIPICTKGGLAFYISYIPKDGKLYGFITNDSTTEKSKLLGSELEQSNFLFKETLKFIKNNPRRILKLEVLKAAYFWSPFDWEILGCGVYNFMYGFVFPFFIYGIIVAFKRFRELLPVYLPIIYSFLFALVTYGSPRFRLPVEPYIIIIASAGIAYFLTRFSKRIYGILLTGVYLLLNLFLYFYSYQVRLIARSIFEKAHLW
ncbi:MAG: glycosyltransferase family 39 protein [Candidatus Omnitrophota bacterium]